MGLLCFQVIHEQDVPEIVVLGYGIIFAGLLLVLLQSDGYFSWHLGFHIQKNGVKHSHLGGGSYSTRAFLLLLSPLLCALLPSYLRVPQGILGVVASRCTSGTRILPSVEFGFLAGTIGRQVWATLELALGLLLDRAANELFYASLL